MLLNLRLNDVIIRLKAFRSISLGFVQEMPVGIVIDWVKISGGNQIASI